MTITPDNPEAQCGCTIEPPHKRSEHYDLVHPPVRRRITDDPNFVPTKKSVRGTEAPSTDGLRKVVPGHEADPYLGKIIENALGNGAEEGPTKASNPKDVVGSRKLSMSCVPWSAIVGLAKALLEGVLKYGRFNWRMCGVRGSVYLDAIKRHIAKYENGQDCDPKTLVHHLDSAMACIAIMRDAMLYNKFEDDRPPCPNPDAMARLIDEGEAFSAQLKQTFKDEKPYQFTINDTRYIQATQEILP